MPHLHPTAVIDPAAQLADDVVVGAYSIIGPKVRVGPGTTIGAHTILENRTTIGAHNRIGHHVVLGSIPQDLKYRGEDAELVIGDHNDIRENVTAHIGTANAGNLTSIGSHNLLMVGVHVAHDCHLRDHTILANNVMLAGHIEIQSHAVVSGGAAVTHFVTIGRYAFIGGTSGVVKDCPPFMISDGNHATVRGVNTIGLARHQFSETTLDRLQNAYKRLFGKRATGISLIDSLSQLESEHGSDPHLLELVHFVRAMAGAPNGRAAEMRRHDNKRASAPR
jgi:UDP-N-acetylglucosamine acyltransferase